MVKVEEFDFHDFDDLTKLDKGWTDCCIDRYYLWKAAGGKLGHLDCPYC